MFRRAAYVVWLVPALLALVGCGERSVSPADARPPDRAPVADRLTLEPPCDCIPIEEWAGYGTCKASFHWGCRGAPRPFQRDNAPAVCWGVAVDPITGCLSPQVAPSCSPGYCIHVDPGPGCDPKIIGKTCTETGGECGPTHVCLTTTPEVGVCTCECTTDDPDTPLINEDSCPELASHMCAHLIGATSKSYCMRTCTPKYGSNECASPHACWPDSGGIFEVRAALCAFPGCKTNNDCPIILSTACSTLDPQQTCSPKQTCVPVAPHVTQGHCAKEGVCDVASGLCKPHALAGAAQVGDPCKDDMGCPGSMSCLMELDQSTIAKGPGLACTRDYECCDSCQGGKCGPGPCATLYRSGYCTIIGCSFAATLPDRACPKGTFCNRWYPGGMCQRACDLTKAASCRGSSSDLYGDYECRAWNNVGAGGPAMSDGPVCDLGTLLRCDALSSQNLDCSTLGEIGNVTNMKCRSLKGAVLSANDPAGFCLDDTASGPLP